MNEYIINDEQSAKEFQEYIQENSLELVKHKFINTKARLEMSDNNLYIVDKEFSNVATDVINQRRLIYGKDDTSHIVNISVAENKVHIFREIDGELTKEIRPYKDYVLSHSEANGAKRLKGNQHFKYIKEYDTHEQYEAIKRNIYKYGLFTIHHKPESYMVRNGLTYFKGMKPEEVSILSFDIETTGLNKDADDAKVFLITNCFRKNGKVEKKTFIVDDYKDDYEMIQNWTKWVIEKDPSIMIGHNIVMFDLPYLNKRTGGLVLGRDWSEMEIEERTREKRKDGGNSYSYNRINIFGREIIDTFFLALDYDVKRKYESYGLKAIIKHECLDKKDRQHYDASKIKENWNIPEEKKKIINYAEDDSDDSLKLFDLMIPATFYLSQYIPKTFQVMTESATGSKVNSFLIRGYLQEDKSIPIGSKNIESIKGGISFAVPGIYRNVMKTDLKSAYPSQILRFKLYDKKKDPEGLFYKMTEFFTLQRFGLKKKYQETKDKIHEDRDKAGKIFINSIYGTCTTNGLNFNSREIGARITEETRKVIDMALTWASGNGAEYWIEKFNKATGKEK